MTKNTRYDYFCSCCRNSIPSLGEGFLVNENTKEFFCSESCIVEFFKPVIESYENREEAFLAQLGSINNEDDEGDIRSNTQQVELTMSDPDEVWGDRNELGQKVFFHIKKFTGLSESTENHWIVLVCSYFGQKPSFIYHYAVTRSSDLVDFYRRGEELNEGAGKLGRGISVGNDDAVRAGTNEDEGLFGTIDPSHNEENSTKRTDMIVPEKIIEEIEAAKSSLLAEILQVRDDNDIPLELYSTYDQYGHRTIEEPDEVFELGSLDLDEYVVFVKSFSGKENPFFYFSICYQMNSAAVAQRTSKATRSLDELASDELGADELTPDEVASDELAPDELDAEVADYLIPVLAFPSINSEVYKLFSTGKCTHRKQVN